MADQLSSDLASLKIDRGAKAGTGSRRSGGLRAAIALLVVGVLGYGAYALGMPYLRARAFPTEVTLTEIALLSPAQSSVRLTSSGYVEPQLVTRVGAKIPGRVARVLVRQGDRVLAGALLLELERADREAALHSARMRAATAVARVATARANLVETRQQARRQRQLAEQGVAAAANAEDLEARAAALEQAVNAAAAEVNAAQAEIDAEHVMLRYMSIRAPIAGTVLTKPPEVGELIGVEIPGVTENVLQLADFSTLMVETDVPEARLHLAKVGSPCEIALDAFPGARYRGEAMEIEPRVDRAKATVGVKVRFVDGNEGVLPDMSARVSFLSEALDPEAMREKSKLVVPASALAERGGAKVVFVVEGGTARMRVVRLGAAIGSGYELIEGPEAGARVVAKPPATLDDGQRVREKGRG
jgi:HlyD family secretion protein